VLEAGVPEIVAVPLPLSTNVTPVGKLPVSVSAGVGVPTAVTEKNPADPTVKVVLLPEVMDAPEFTVNVKLCTAAVPTPLLAVNVNEYIPAMPTAGVPLNMPVPFPLSVNVTPVGSGPVSVNAGVGEPTVVTMNDPEACSVKVVPLPELIAAPSFTVNTKF
jgi:hypothetical protein